VLWDYEAGTFATPPITYDVFCSGQATLANGDVLAAGGTMNYDPFQGAPQAAVFSAVNEVWTNVADMADGRWYPTLVSLGDGTVVAVSGTNAAGSGPNEVPGKCNPTGAPGAPSQREPRAGHSILTSSCLGTAGCSGQGLAWATRI
jgi:hypothetical protein